MSAVLGCLGDMLNSIFVINLPFGVTFGSLVCAVFGLPLLVRAIRKFF